MSQTAKASPIPSPTAGQQIATVAANAVEFPDLGDLGEHFPSHAPIFGCPAGEFARTLAELAASPEQDGLLQGPVHGYLRKADALALHDLAWHAAGDVLELGAAWGLSTVILARAVSAARPAARLVSVDIDPGFHRLSQAAVNAEGLSDHLLAIHGDAGEIVVRLADQGRRFGLVFVDHDHSRPATQRVCDLLSRLVLPGGWVAFHDFNDARNRTEPAEYGIYPAVEALLRKPVFTFCGVVGCMGLIRMNEG